MLNLQDERAAALAAEFSALRNESIDEDGLPPSEDLPVWTEAIMVLSGPTSLGPNGKVIEKSPENIARVHYGVDLFRKILAAILNKDAATVTDGDILDSPIALVLNGDSGPKNNPQDRGQLDMMLNVALEYGFPRDQIVLYDCLPKGDANTRTQFTSDGINGVKLADFDHLTIVTTRYHVPRVRRTAEKHMPEGVNFRVLGVPPQRFLVDETEKVPGEIERIITYSEKGDIAY